MIKAILLSALLVASPAQAAIEKTRLPQETNFKCADALSVVRIMDTPAGPRLRFYFAEGFQSCENEIMDVEPAIVRGKRCILIRFPEGEQTLFCLPPSAEI